MKDIRPALREYLLGDANISTAVAGVRVYPIKIPQGIKAASIVYTRISGAGDYDMNGPTGLSGPRYQIDAWAPLANDATSLANLIKDRIDGFKGVMGSGGDAVTVQGVFYNDQRENYDDIAQLHRVGRDFFIWYEEL